MNTESLERLADVHPKADDKDTDKDTDKDSEKKPKQSKIRCAQCRKKVPLISFTCKCRKIFCVVHQSPHNHSCVYDFQAEIRDKIKLTNPKVCPTTLVNPI
jgi:predicted nucleic acid binding AN1-type Zn finger protein